MKHANNEVKPAMQKNAHCIFSEKMNNHTEIRVNVLKSVAYDDNRASQHKNTHLNQLRNKSQTVDFIF